MLGMATHQGEDAALMGGVDMGRVQPWRNAAQDHWGGAGGKG